MSNQLTPAEIELFNAIKDECEANGEAISLFNIAVVGIGQDYSQAYARLARLVKRKLVRIKRRGRGRSLIICVAYDGHREEKENEKSQNSEFAGS